MQRMASWTHARVEREAESNWSAAPTRTQYKSSGNRKLNRADIKEIKSTLTLDRPAIPDAAGYPEKYSVQCPTLLNSTRRQAADDRRQTTDDRRQTTDVEAKQPTGSSFVRPGIVIQP
ncbi:hypothetical protein J3458_019933 [Metarhizium acridum]|uniref:uncharacterized protein n=1 Tax=Metarhizium acridum TaxID=92637 RepID=UPI001C6CDB09|nr:hypothetical protein J3458_019933 [Metarhizium acridum]